LRGGGVMIYGSLNQNEKELKKAVLIVSADELSNIIAACEEYAKINPRKKKFKLLLKELDDIAVF